VSGEPTWRDPAGPAVVVDPYSSGAEFAPAFRARGVRVVGVMSAAEPPDVYAASFRPDDLDEILVAGDDPAPLVRRLRELRPRCILAGCESGVSLAERLAPAVVPDVANDPATADARRDKGAMGRALRRAGVPAIPEVCTADPLEVAAWIEREGLGATDLVVKPPASASTDGVTRVPAGTDWRPVFAGLLGATNRLGLRNEELVVQAFVRGVEYVVDTVSLDGEHGIADVCRYEKIDNGAHMAVYDAMTWVAPDAPETATVAAYARRVLDAVGMRWGTSHVEIMLTPQGPRLVEIAARPHGGGHPRFCRLATGDSQVDRVVRWFTDGTPAPAHYALQAHTAVVFHLVRAAGRVTNTAVLEQVPTLPSHVHSVRHLREGQEVTATRDLFATMDLGFAVLSHPDPDRVAADRTTLRDLEARLLITAPAGVRG
jgi:glutathione synthase/RimK-type ligase-like ATP-grasp enzyme